MIRFSGGPLLMLTNTSESIVGITSFGQACGTVIPGIYTSVFPYLDWIESHVWPPGDDVSDQDRVIWSK